MSHREEGSDSAKKCDVFIIRIALNCEQYVLIICFKM